MPAPLGWERRDNCGPVGLLARWWCERRVRRVRQQLAGRRTPIPDQTRKRPASRIG